MKVTPTTSLKRLKIKYSPQETNVQNSNSGFHCTLKSIREDKVPIQERKRLSLIQK